MVLEEVDPSTTVLAADIAVVLHLATPKKQEHPPVSFVGSHTTQQSENKQSEVQLVKPGGTLQLDPGGSLWVSPGEIAVFLPDITACCCNFSGAVSFLHWVKNTVVNNTQAHNFKKFVIKKIF